MRVAIFDTHKFDRVALEATNHDRHQMIFIDTALNPQTAILAQDAQAVCCFVNDRVDATTLHQLHKMGIKIVALRCAGFNNVDVTVAKSLGITVVRVPEYSPYAVAEHAVALLLTHNRKTHKAHNRTRDLNFSLDSLTGFDLHGKTIGIIGTGRIGRVFGNIMNGFGCRIIAFDHSPDTEWARQTNARYVDRTTLFRESDVISLHVPLNEGTRHFINADAFSLMKKEALVINTGRGALIDTKALLEALKTRRIGGACLDVYEEEEGVFFSDRSESGIEDDLLARLLTFPNVLITSHQAFLTHEALANIAETTLSSLSTFEAKGDLAAVLVC